MKCSHCGGSLIYHPGNCLEKAALKCMACGREGRKNMESKTKRCSKCLEEKSFELFSINKSNNDGHEYICKDCMQKRMKDYRDKKAGVRRQKSPALRGLPQMQAKVARPSHTITRATPEQIIADLRRGLAIEIIDMIQEKFGL